MVKAPTSGGQTEVLPQTAIGTAAVFYRMLASMTRHAHPWALMARLENSTHPQEDE